MQKSVQSDALTFKCICSLLHPFFFEARDKKITLFVKFVTGTSKFFELGQEYQVQLDTKAKWDIFLSRDEKEKPIFTGTRKECDRFIKVYQRALEA